MSFIKLAACSSHDLPLNGTFSLGFTSREPKEEQISVRCSFSFELVKFVSKKKKLKSTIEVQQ